MFCMVKTNLYDHLDYIVLINAVILRFTKNLTIRIHDHQK